MPRIVMYEEGFISDLERIKEFLNDIEVGLHTKFALIFIKKLLVIKNNPKAFTPFGENRIYFLQFGASGYAIQYYYDETLDIIKLLRIKHQKEVGF